MLKKVGLTFDKSEKTTTIIDPQRWQSISLLERIQYRMPSTTNALESTSGHLNSKTPRRNNFFISLQRLVLAIMKKSNNIDKNIRRNYNTAKRKTFQHQAKVLLQRIEEEISYYESTRDHCHCGENKLLGAIYIMDLPCIHRIKLGAQRRIVKSACCQLLPTATLDFTSTKDSIQLFQTHSIFKGFFE